MSGVGDAQGRSAGGAAQHPQDPPGHPFLVQVDHVGIEAPDPAALLRFFAEGLGLPEVFPFTIFPGFATGSVALGNAYLEVLRFGRRPRTGVRGTARYRILGFLVPPGALPPATAELERRSIARSGVVPFYVPASLAPEPVVAWESVFLGDLLGGGVATRLFFAATRRVRLGRAAQQSPPAAALTPPLLRRAFPDGIAVLTDYRLVNDDRKRAADRDALRSRGGGALGLDSAAEVLVDASPRQASAWRRLLDPLAAGDDGAWVIGTGPVVRLVRSGSPGIAGLRLRVGSVGAAERALRRLSVPVTVTDDGLAFSPPGAAGVSIELVDAEP